MPSTDTPVTTCFASYGPAQGAKPPIGEPDKYDPKVFHSYFGKHPQECAGWYEAGRFAYIDFAVTVPPAWMNEAATYWWRLGNEHAQIERLRRDASQAYQRSVAACALTPPE